VNVVRFGIDFDIAFAGHHKGVQPVQRPRRSTALPAIDACSEFLPLSSRYYQDWTMV
jgi:hypothetical protein